MDFGDYLQIKNLIHSYPYLLDRGDFDAVGALFADATVYSAGVLMADRDPSLVASAFRDWLYVYDDGSPRTRHCLANLVVEPDGADRAIVRSYVMVFQQTGALPLQPIIGGDYRDTVERIDGRWRITERHMGNDLVGNLSAHGRDASIITPTRANG